MTREALVKEVRREVVAFMESNYHLTPKKVNLDRIGKNEFIELVIRYVCEKTNTLPEQIKTKDNHRPFVEARMLITKIIKDNFGELISLGCIGSILNKDHATLVHYKKTLVNVMDTEPVKRRFFNKVINGFNKEYSEYIEKIKRSYRN